MSNETVHVYECDSCAWKLDVPVQLSLGEIENDFNAHDFKDNSVKKRPIRDHS